MEDYDDEELRRKRLEKRREESDCEEVIDPENCKVDLPDPYRRKLDPCGDEELPDICDPVDFVEPSEDDTLDSVFVPPYPKLILKNSKTFKSCSDPSLGHESTITGSPFTATLEAGELTEVISFSKIPNLTTAQRVFIGTLTDATMEAILLPETTVDWLISTLRLRTEQAVALKYQVTSALELIETTADNILTGRLNCYYENQFKRAFCNPTTDIQPSFNDVNKGEVISRVSQEDADTKAESLAQAGLECQYGNDTITINCDPLPNGPVPDSAVIYASTPPNTVVSNSKANANAAALTIAQAKLNCVYYNKAANYTCPPDSNGVQADIIEGKNPLPIKEKTVISYVSTEDADFTAHNLAQASAQCVWSNPELTFTCKDFREDVDTIAALESGGCPEVPDGEPVYSFNPSSGDCRRTVYPSELGSPIYSITIPAGQFESRVSQEDALSQARLFASTQLVCTYCNYEIAALCPPKLPTNNPDYLPIEPKGHLAINYKENIPEGAYCAESYAEAVALAEASAATPSIEKDSCLFGNDEIRARCSPMGNEASGYKWVFAFPDTEFSDFSPNSSPNPYDVTSYIIVSANTVVISTNEGTASGNNAAKREANDIASNIALAMLNCFFENDIVTVACASSNPPHYNSAYQDLGLQSPEDFAALIPGTLPAGTIVSFTSKENANFQAELLASAMRVCVPVIVASGAEGPPGPPGPPGPAGASGAAGKPTCCKVTETGEDPKNLEINCNIAPIYDEAAEEWVCPPDAGGVGSVRSGQDGEDGEPGLSSQCAGCSAMLV